MKSHLLFINSTIAFAGALMLAITFHEFGHAFAAMVFGLHPVVYVARMDYSPTSPTNAAIIAMAGPLLSLLLGVLTFPLVRYFSGFSKLFILWFSLICTQTFFGYLMTAPFVSFGDIGKFLHLLQAPIFVNYLCLVVGAVGTFMLGQQATNNLLRLTDPKNGDTTSQLRQVGLFAWLAGVLLTIIVSGASDTQSMIGVFEFMGSLTSGIFLTSVRFFMNRTKVKGEGIKLSFPVVGLIIVIILALLRNFILLPGLQF